jgi:hypothetical protein
VTTVFWFLQCVERPLAVEEDFASTGWQCRFEPRRQSAAPLRIVPGQSAEERATEPREKSQTNSTGCGCQLPLEPFGLPGELR